MKYAIERLFKLIGYTLLAALLAMYGIILFRTEVPPLTGWSFTFFHGYLLSMIFLGNYLINKKFN